MNDPIYSSNNEEGLVKSVGPYRITTAGISIMGVRLPRVIKLAAPIPVGTLKIYGTQIIFEPVPSPNENPTSK